MGLLGTSTKVEKGVGKGVLTAVMYLSPADESGRNVCPHATPGCKAACLGHSSGRMAMPMHKQVRKRKTDWFFDDRPAFLVALMVDIERHKRKADKAGMVCAVRLNGTSDIPWETVAPGIFERFPTIQFYDYTKHASRAVAWAQGRMPPNYHLTFSWAETARNQAEAVAVMAAGGNVAVVFSAPPYPDVWRGLPVVDGDEDDIRFRDPKGCIVGLKAKGAAKRDTSGFVVQLTKIER